MLVVNVSRTSQSRNDWNWYTKYSCIKTLLTEQVLWVQKKPPTLKLQTTSGQGNTTPFRPKALHSLSLFLSIQTLTASRVWHGFPETVNISCRLYHFLSHSEPDVSFNILLPIITLCIGVHNLRNQNCMKMRHTTHTHTSKIALEWRRKIVVYRCSRGREQRHYGNCNLAIKVLSFLTLHFDTANFPCGHFYLLVSNSINCFPLI